MPTHDLRPTKKLPDTPNVRSCANLGYSPKFAHMQQSDLINSAQAAAILLVDRATFNRWATKGLVPIAIQGPGLTGMRFYHRADILELATSRRAA